MSKKKSAVVVSERERVGVILPRNIARLRAAKGFASRRDFATACGLHEDVLQKVELGHRLPSVETLVKIADALGVQVDVLVGAEVASAV